MPGKIEYSFSMVQKGVSDNQLYIHNYISFTVVMIISSLGKLLYYYNPHFIYTKLLHHTAVWSQYNEYIFENMLLCCQFNLISHTAY